jgi:hypothetical protein
MPDWTKPMQQTYEYYIVDPGTWKDTKKLDIVKSSTINRDAGAETLGSASFVVTDTINECYIRTYLVTVQNGVTEKHVLGTHLVQTPSSKFNGKVKDTTLDGYTSLLELKENNPPIGFYIPKGDNVMDRAYMLVRENARAPVAKPSCPSKVTSEIVADPNDTWLTYLSDVVSSQIYEDKRLNVDKNREYGPRITQYGFDVDEMGQILFAPKQDIDTMQHVWTFSDDNSSILHPDITMEHDLYGIPNTVEVIYSEGSSNYHVKKTNNDPNSPISTVSRGREILYRVTNPSFPGTESGQYPTPKMIDEYATQLLRTLSTLRCSVSYTHGYCPVRLNDCVMLNYTRAGLNNVKAKVINQSIKCSTGCTVTEKAIFTIKLWEG